MIKEILKTLTPEQYKEIKYAFDNEQECVIKIDGNRFIAVNLTILSYKVIENRGAWFYGELP